ncbi:MAG: hypothetical protein IIA59_11885 [Candidatus Marinimicrobia bacterium]|nr:hypothetical protein [Candidatus Neomarinimicrobiota bacterium]
MAKRLPISPIYSKLPQKNFFDWWDDKTQRYVKCAGFVLDFWDNESQTRIRRRIKEDYQTAKKAYTELKALQADGNESLPILIMRDKIKTLGDLFQKYEEAKTEPSLRNRQARSQGTIDPYQNIC